MTQLSAVTGRRARSTLADQINAQTPYLTSLYSLKNQQDYYDNQTALAEEELAQQELAQEQENALAQQSLALTKEQMEQNKKQQKTENALGLAGLGATAGFGALKYSDDIKQALGTVGDAASSAAGKAVLSNSPYGVNSEGVANGYDAMSFTSGGAGSSGGFYDSLSDIGSNSWKALSSANTLLSGALGATLGTKLGEEVIPIGGKTEKKVAGGALTGALSGLLSSGGDVYSTAISGIIGGLGGFF